MPITKKHVAIGFAGLAASTIAMTAANLSKEEGFAPVATHERIDPPGVITWCFGRTNYDDPTVKVGERFTKEKCEELLREDIPKYAAPVAKCIPSFATMPPHRQMSLIDVSYNGGAGMVCNGSIARKFNAGDVKGGCEAILKYNLVNGKVCDGPHCGVGARRRRERDLCERED